MRRSNKSKRAAQGRLGTITGRDGYIVAKALAYAIEVIAALPDKRRELSDRRDMRKILHTAFSGIVQELVTESACHHLFHPGSVLTRNTGIDDSSWTPMPSGEGLTQSA